VDRVDAYQRRHPVLGFPLGVVYKFFDDQGPYLAAILTYYTFIAIFPLLLIASSVLGFVLQGNEELQADLLDSALSRFPIVGTQLGRPEGLRGSTSAVVIGSAAALYGMLGLGQAAQNALNVAWAVPRNSRLNPLIGRVRSLVALVLAGVAVLAITVVAGFASNLRLLGLDDARLQWLSTLLSVALTAVVLSLMMRFTTSRRPSFRTSLPGGIVIAVMWHVLQALGGVYVRRVVAAASDMNGVFALVLGLFALIFLAAAIAVLGLEINVVLNRRLYPRALLTPFTDAVMLTDADRRAYDSYAKAQRHKGFQHVEVTFYGRADDRDDDPPT
jgi:inner membrane protein YhjD